MFNKSEYRTVDAVKKHYKPLEEIEPWEFHWQRDRAYYVTAVSAAYQYMRQHPYGVIGNDSIGLVFDAGLSRPGYEHHVDGFRTRMMLLANISEIDLSDRRDFSQDDFDFVAMIFYYHRMLLMSVSYGSGEFEAMFSGCQKPDYPKTANHLESVSRQITNAITWMVQFKK